MEGKWRKKGGALPPPEDWRHTGKGGGRTEGISESRAITPPKSSSLSPRAHVAEEHK